MRTLYLAIPVCLVLAAPNAGAQSKDYPATDSTSLLTVQVTAPPQAIHVSEDETMPISGTYAMSNGWRMHVQPARDGIVAKIDKERPMRLLAVSADKYMTRDGNVVMEFNRGRDRDDMMMSYVPTSNLAAVVVMTANVASR
ncbi:hypothetical protein [Massilia sp. 9096]|uniref:hypothetical protein n=1 Tax=Massilia sp. 9096 TaxID=1500894 RepID=UPI0012E02F01|nr:hypothetical protein [Massilia sp. 9096]